MGMRKILHVWETNMLDHDVEVGYLGLRISNNGQPSVSPTRYSMFG
jgi:hypothetical protein